MSADSIKVAWSPAPTASSVSVTYYINASSPTYQAIRRSVTDPGREVFISGLHPFAEYYITIQAGNPGGLSEPIGTSATTLTAGKYHQSYIIQSLIGYLSTLILHSTGSSVCPSCNAGSEGERGTLGHSWLEHSPRSREEWHHHSLYCPTDRHQPYCYPE